MRLGRRLLLRILLLFCFVAMMLGVANAADNYGVEALFQLSWTSTLQSGLPVVVVVEGNTTTQSSALNGSSSSSSAVEDSLLLSALEATLNNDGGETSFTKTINQVLREQNMDAAFIVSGTSAQDSRTQALVPQSCMDANNGVLRNFVNTSTGLCQPCTVCAGAYVGVMCAPYSDTVCVSACTAGQYTYTSGIRPPELGGCSPCFEGTYKPADDEGGACKPCPAGTIAPHVGAAVCTACAANTVAVDAVACLSVRPLGLASLIKSTRRRFPSGSACVCAARGQAHAITI